jgi:hypothetical protein
MPVMTDRRGHLIGGAIVLLALIAVAGAFALPSRRADRPADPVAPGSPFETAISMLGHQADALIAGDRKGWLAAVDPSQPELVTTYRSMFDSLRALDITQFRYQPMLLGSETDPALSIDGKIAYCFADCSLSGSGGIDPPDAHQHLTVRRVGGRPLITDMVQYQQDDHLAPTPWETGPLVFKQGARVTVAAAPSEAGYLDNVLSIAERGAAAADRFATAVGNQQRRYRIFLADDASWKNWYGGSTDAGAAYTMPLPGSGADVVLHIDRIGDDQEWLPFTVRSQLGRVVAQARELSQTPYDSAPSPGKNDWLTDGIANWIGWSPQPARSGPWAPDVRTMLNSAHPPTTMVQPSIYNGAPEATVRTFFGLGQFAAECLATQYGEPAFFAFAKDVLQERLGADNASTSAFHKPFAQVDKGCMTWIRQQAG